MLIKLERPDRNSVYLKLAGSCKKQVLYLRGAVFIEPADLWYFITQSDPSSIYFNTKTTLKHSTSIPQLPKQSAPDIKDLKLFINRVTLNLLKNIKFKIPILMD